VLSSRTRGVARVAHGKSGAPLGRGALHRLDVSFSVKNLSLFAFQAVAVFDSMWRVARVSHAEWRAGASPVNHATRNPRDM
jgi:hypothetical protein